MPRIRHPADKECSDDGGTFPRFYVVELGSENARYRDLTRNAANTPKAYNPNGFKQSGG